MVEINSCEQILGGGMRVVGRGTAFICESWGGASGEVKWIALLEEVCSFTVGAKGYAAGTLQQCGPMNDCVLIMVEKVVQ
jgi:hypothetical protein